MVALRVHRLRSQAVLPRYESAAAAGLDLAAALDLGVTLQPGEFRAIPTGLAIALPPGHEGQVRPRSGLARKHGVTVLNSPGTIDADYRGEVQVLLINHGPRPHRIEPGERIAQLVVAPVVQAEVLEVQDAGELGDTERGVGGFGSTGR